MFCPVCGVENPDEAVRCAGCGEVLDAGAPKVSLSKEPAAAPAPRRKFSPKSIVSMILGLISLGFATTVAVYGGLIVTLFEAIRLNVPRPSGSYNAYFDSTSAFEAAMLIAVMCFIFAAAGIGTAIPALILSPKGMREGTAPGNHGMAKCGRITAVISLILCAVGVAMAIIAYSTHVVP